MLLSPYSWLDISCLAHDRIFWLLPSKRGPALLSYSSTYGRHWVPTLKELHAKYVSWLMLKLQRFTVFFVRCSCRQCQNQNSYLYRPKQDKALSLCFLLLEKHWKLLHAKGPSINDVNNWEGSNIGQNCQWIVLKTADMGRGVSKSGKIANVIYGWSPK